MLYCCVCVCVFCSGTLSNYPNPLFSIVLLFPLFYALPLPLAISLLHIPYSFLFHSRPSSSCSPLPGCLASRLSQNANNKDLRSWAREVTSPRPDSLRLALINMFCSPRLTLPHALDLHILSALSLQKRGEGKCSRKSMWK